MNTPIFREATVNGYLPEIELCSDHYTEEVHARLKEQSANRIKRELPSEARLLTYNHTNSAVYGHGILDILSFAYNNHLKIAIAPHDLWQVVTAQVRDFVMADAEKYRSLFISSSSEKPLILVDTIDETAISAEKLIEAVTPYVPTRKDIFIPNFSTHTPASRAANYATFLESLSSYYDFGTYCCGIRSVALLGTREDWTLFVEALHEMIGVFLTYESAERLVNYLSRTVTFVSSFLSRDDDDFAAMCADIFRQKNVGSGAQLAVNGWIANFWRVTPNSSVLGNFTRTWGAIPYTNMESKRTFISVHGCFMGKMRDDDYLVTDYGNVVFETTP